jgi:hypothetical protein
VARQRVVWSNFAQGMDEFYGFRGGRIEGVSEELRNFKVDRHGRLAPRGGSFKFNAVTEESGPVTAISAVVTDGTTASNPSVRSNRVAMQLNAAGLSRLQAVPDGAGARNSNNTIEEVKNASTNADSSIPPWGLEQLNMKALVFNQRIFMNASISGFGMMWGDSASALTGPSKVYQVGSAAPAAITLAVNNNATGTDLDASSWYGAGYTYYNSTYGIETDIIRDTVQTDGTNRTVRITLTETVDEGFDQYRVYRTTGQASTGAAAAASLLFVAALTKDSATSTEFVDIDATEHNLNAAGATAYTIGSANNTTSHAVLSDPVAYFESWKNRLWCVVLPRRVRFSHRTSTAVLPDWFRTNDYVDIGSGDSHITGIVEGPSGNALIVFTNTDVFRITGSDRQTIRVDTALAGIGCPYPRTIQKLGNAIYFLAQDNQVYKFDGAQAQPVSLPVNESLKDIKLYWARMPVAGVKGNEYWLAYPSGTAITTTTGTLTTGSAGTRVFGTGTPLAVSDGTAWDLSGVAIGDHIQNTLPEQYHGVVTTVDDANDRITWEQGTDAASTVYAYSIYRNDREVVFDTLLNLWRGQRGRSVFCYSWDYPRSREFYAGLFGNGFVIEADTTDATDFASAAITSLWKSPLVTLPVRAQFHGLRVLQIGGVESSLTVKGFINHSSTATQLPAAGAPGSDDQYWYGFSDASGYACQVTVEGTAMGTIVAIILEYETVDV